MGTIWHSNGFGFTAGGVPHVKTGTGAMPGRYVWRHNGTAWVQVWQRDVTPPNAPSIDLGIVDGTKNVVQVTVHTPAAPIIRTIVKVGVNTWPQGPLIDDGCYYAQTSPGGWNPNEPWSDWWSAAPASTYGAGGITGIKTIPASYQTFSFPLSTNIMVAAWCQDDFFNWSAAGSNYITTLAADPPAPVVHAVGQFFNATESHTWNNSGGNWSSAAESNGYLYQGGGYAQDGYWWYGDGPRAAMASATEVTKANIYVQRVNSVHGVSGGANIHLRTHTQLYRDAGGPPGLLGGEYIPTFTLERGAGGWVDLTASWGAQVQSGYLAGFGIGTVGTTSYSSADYAICYGAGTSSGQVYYEWNQY